MKCNYWISGFPATFATAREIIWKKQIFEALSGKAYDESSISLKFVFTKDHYERFQFDIDNLCEPVFAVLTTSLGWFSGKRRNITRWTARKCIGQEQGLLISAIDADTPSLPSGIPIFDEVYEGVLPNSATDPEIPLWMAGLGQFKRADRLSLRLIFQNTPLSIATISSGKVKPIIDCLYPIIGGVPGAPKDEIIEMLTGERESRSAKKPSIRIAIRES